MYHSPWSGALEASRPASGGPLEYSSAPLAAQCRTVFEVISFPDAQGQQRRAMTAVACPPDTDPAEFGRLRRATRLIQQECLAYALSGKPGAPPFVPLMVHTLHETCPLLDFAMGLTGINHGITGQGPGVGAALHWGKTKGAELFAAKHQLTPGNPGLHQLETHVHVDPTLESVLGRDRGAGLHLGFGKPLAHEICEVASLWASDFGVPPGGFTWCTRTGLLRGKASALRCLPEHAYERQDGLIGGQQSKKGLWDA